MKIKVSETALVKSVLQLLALRKIFAWKNATTGVYDPAKKLFRKFTGLRGVSDVIGVLPAKGRDSPMPFGAGRFLAIEAKVGRNVCTPEQNDFLNRINAMGGLGIVVSSLDQLEAILKLEGY